MEIPRITVQEVAERMRRGEQVTFLDARSAHAYEAAVEQLPGSVRVPPTEIDAHVSSLAHGPTYVAYCT